MSGPPEQNYLPRLDPDQGFALSYRIKCQWNEQSRGTIMSTARCRIIEIDEEKCDGCGQCVTACAEGAIEIRDGKARLVAESYCDGLGACLGECPQDAIRVIEREADAYSEEMVRERRAGLEAKRSLPTLSSGCPGAAVQSLIQGPTIASSHFGRRCSRRETATGGVGPGELADTASAGSAQRSVPARCRSAPGGGLRAVCDGGFPSAVARRPGRGRLPETRRRGCLRREAIRHAGHGRRAQPDRRPHGSALLYRPAADC